MAKRSRQVKSAKKASPKRVEADSYEHPESTLPMRPDVGTQPQFKKKKPPQQYRYDSSLAPSLEWDGQNAAREQGEALIAQIETLSESLFAAFACDALSDSEKSASQANAANIKADCGSF